MGAITNPRYIAYATAHGEYPDDMMERDREEWPGGVMCGYVLWHKERIREFAQKERVCCERCATWHADYDVWLNGWAQGRYDASIGKACDQNRPLTVFQEGWQDGYVTGLRERRER